MITTLSLIHKPRGDLMKILCPFCGSGLSEAPVETVHDGKTGFTFKCYACGHDVFFTAVEYANLLIISETQVNKDIDK